MRIEKHRRFWKVIDQSGQLVCLAVYKRGAIEVVRRLQELQDLASRRTRHHGPMTH